MMLTPIQHKLIDKHLRTDNWLLNNDLVAELTDHYMDAITDMMAQNVPFELALQEVHRSFGGRRGLLKMEENYQKTQARTNSRVYRDAFKKAFQWPGIRYTFLVWAVCYGIVRTFPIEWLSTQVDRFSDVGFFCMMCLFTSTMVYSFVKMYRELRTGKLSLHSLHAPVYTMFQSTICIGYFSFILPLRQLSESHAVLCALVMTLIVIHEWAGMHMITAMYRKRLT